ncbi:MAG: hypothetical protein H0V17_21235 [Deltaproteobacteria bacterium]|nr:hypothetical protein [Deltaproteobacteria bacterium]
MLSRLIIQLNGSVAATVIGRIADAVSPLEHLEINHTVIPFSIGNVPPIADAFWNHVPHLRTLKLSNPGLFATLRHAGLEELTIEGDSPARNPEELWELPALARLSWSNSGTRTNQLWRSPLPALRELDLYFDMLRLFDHERFFDVVRQLETLSLTRSAIHSRNQTAERRLIERAEQLAHLRSLVVFSPKGLSDQAVKRRLPNLDWGPGR